MGGRGRCRRLRRYIRRGGVYIGANCEGTIIGRVLRSQEGDKVDGWVKQAGRPASRGK